MVWLILAILIMLEKLEKELNGFSVIIIIVFINFFRRVFSEYTEVNATSLTRYHSSSTDTATLCLNVS